MSTVEALADMTPEQLEAIEGIGPKTVEKISLAVNNYFASLESGAAVDGEAPVEGVVEGEAALEYVAAAQPGAGADDITAEIPAAVEESASARRNCGECGS